MAPRPAPEGSPLSLDRIVHGPLRLGIVVALATAERRTFTELRDALGATDGNLNASLQKLEQAGYVAASRKSRPIRWASRCSTPVSTLAVCSTMSARERTGFRPSK